MNILFEIYFILQISDLPIDETTTITSNPRSKRPPLTKQKRSLCEDLEDMENLCNGDILQTVEHSRGWGFGLRKQSSLNDELMSTNRLREKERVRRRIQKQTSLNEAFLCRSLFVNSASRRFQVLREGLSMRIKTTSGSLERVTRHGIVRMLQELKSNSNNTSEDNGPILQKHENGSVIEESESQIPPSSPNPNSANSSGTQTHTPNQRHHSREDGSGNNCLCISFIGFTYICKSFTRFVEGQQSTK